jgi:chromosome segregation ATPase
METPELQEAFNLGKMVGEAMAKIQEQERIIELIEEMDVTITDANDEPVDIIKLDFSGLYEQIRGHSEGDLNADFSLD